MKPNVRVTSDEPILRHSIVEVAGPNEEWVDISNMVSGISWNVKVNEASRVSLTLLPATMRFSGRLDEATLEAFAAHLRLNGYVVTKEEM